MELELTGKRVLVTGASRGIGLAIARGFLREGARVALLARSAPTLEEAAGRLAAESGWDRLLTLAADCAEHDAWPEIVARLREAWGALDAVVANVGDGRSVADPLPSAATFAQTWRTNFATAENTARAAIPLMERNGCLLFISSIAGLEAIGAPTDYSVAKSAVLALSKQLARKLAPGIRVNCLAPGNVHFAGGVWDARLQADPTSVEARINAAVPMRRFGRPEEIADAALFLCSARASFITGACIVADGGQTVGM